MGMWTVIAAHVLFNIAVVCLIVRARLAGMDRSLVEASEDLYATPLGHVPASGVAAAAALHHCRRAARLHLLVSKISSSPFSSPGSDITLPIYVYSSIRRGVTPEINAIGTIVLMTSFTLLIAAQLILRDRTRRRTVAGG